MHHRDPGSRRAESMIAPHAISRRSFFRSAARLSAATIVTTTFRSPSSVAEAALSAAALSQQGSALQSTSAGISDWPEWRGRGRLGVWTEPGILDRFPARGLEIVWRAPIRSGFAGPAVTGGRVFVTDFSSTRVL